MKEIYLDNSATTRVCNAAAEKAVEIMTRVYGNPSSLHSKGLEAEHELTAATESVASALGARPDEIFFTSGGTESNNTAVFGAAHALKRRGNRIVTTAIEHSSVQEAMKELEKEGFEVVYLMPDESGTIPAASVKEAINKNTVLVSMMYVNNETGAILPVEEVKRQITLSDSPALFHIDAVQAFLKLPINVKKLGADLVSVSGHKIHAPKGVGALFVRKGARILPLHFGGEQQSRLRPGTEPLPAICAMGEAVREYSDIKAHYSSAEELWKYCRKRLEQLDGAVINSPENALPYIINFSLPGLRSETILHFLEQEGIYVSSGSACAKGHSSHVLSAMGLPREKADSAVRVSFSDENTVEDIDKLINSLEIALSTLARTIRK